MSRARMASISDLAKLLKSLLPLKWAITKLEVTSSPASRTARLRGGGGGGGGTSEKSDGTSGASALEPDASSSLIFFSFVLFGGASSSKSWPLATLSGRWARKTLPHASHATGVTSALSFACSTVPQVGQLRA